MFRHKYIMREKDINCETQIFNKENKIGVTLNNGLMFNAHIQKVTAKVSWYFGIPFKYLDVHTFFQRFHKTHLKYANAIQHPFYKSGWSVSREKFQRWVIRLLKECQKYHKTKRLR